MDDYEIQDNDCPKCENEISHTRTCDNIHCNDGYIDEHDSDAINFMEGESLIPCSDCNGKGIQHWCPNCGHDYNKK